MNKYTKHLIPLDEFVSIIDKLKPTEFKKAVKEYTEFLSSEPRRTDFINYDNEGFDLFDNEPLFKGFVTSDEASTKEKKVATIQGTCIYFYDPEDVKGVVFYHPHFSTDQCTYNELAIAFNEKNGLEPLEFV